MLKRYEAPDGTFWLYEEGSQPKGYVAADGDKPAAAKPKAKSATPKNKSRSPKAK